MLDKLDVCLGQGIRLGIGWVGMLGCLIYRGDRVAIVPVSYYIIYVYSAVSQILCTETGNGMYQTGNAHIWR